MKKPLVEIISRIARGAAPATAIVTSLAAPLAQGASGDLDPAFADVGRLSQIPGLDGAAWSVIALEEGSALFGGGDFKIEYDWFCYYDSDGCDLEASNFAGRLTREGTIDPAFAAADVADVEVSASHARRMARSSRPVARSPATSRHSKASSSYSASRATGRSTPRLRGRPVRIVADDYGPVHEAQASRSSRTGASWSPACAKSDGDGALVSELIVLRLRPDGRLDGSFGTGGIYVGPAVPYGNTIRLARTAAGAYRIAAATMPAAP